MKVLSPAKNEDKNNTVINETMKEGDATFVAKDPKTQQPSKRIVIPG